MNKVMLVILVAGLAACPIACLIMQTLLQEYACRIPVTATPFILAVFGLGLITAVLIYKQAIKGTC